MEWTEEVILRLRGLWTEGHSTAEIGRRLGVSKNAVVGKAHRLDLAARPSPIRRDGPQSGVARRVSLRRVAGPTLPPLSSISAPLVERPAAAVVPTVVARIVDAVVTAPRAAPVAPPRPVEAPAPRIVAARPYARQLTCCWPIGEPGTKSFRFCDDGAVGGKPYCAEHASLAYVRVRDRREDAASA